MELEIDVLDLRYERLRRRDPRKESRLLISLAECGQQFPIIVVGPDEVPVVVDGYKRVRAMRKLGREMVDATRWEVEESQAVMLEALMRRGGSDGPLEEAWKLDELQERFDLAAVELARRFDRSVSWVSRRLALVKALPVEIQEHVRSGSIAAYTAMKFLVPLARTNRRDAAQIAAAVAPLRMTTRQMHDLYVAYMKSPPEGRRRIVENPGLFLRAVDEQTRAPKIEPSPGGVIIEDLGTMGGVARRIHRRLREGIARHVSPYEHDDVLLCLEQTEKDTRSVGTRLRKELADARRGDTNGDSQTR